MNPIIVPCSDSYQMSCVSSRSKDTVAALHKYVHTVGREHVRAEKDEPLGDQCGALSPRGQTSAPSSLNAHNDSLTIDHNGCRLGHIARRVCTCGQLAAFQPRLAVCRAAMCLLMSLVVQARRSTSRVRRRSSRRCADYMDRTWIIKVSTI